MRKKALITGASSWIWAATACWLAAAWYDVILLARRKERLEEVKDIITSSYDVNVAIHICDVTDYGRVEQLWKEITWWIDVLVNNAWLALGKSSFQDSERSDLEKMVDVNILGFLKVAQVFSKHLIKAQGHMINISSISWVMAYPWWHAYWGTKSFVNQFSQNLRIDFLWSWVRVTDIAPWKVHTEFSKVRFSWDEDKAKSEYVWYEELQAEDIASTIVYCTTVPKHVNIDYMLVNSTDWARPGFANIQNS